MIRKIIQIGNPKLRKVSESIPVDLLDTPEITSLKEDLLDTLNAQKVGVGISAVQIGELKRIFLVHIKPNKKDERISSGIGPKFFINPVILESSQEEVSIVEGCLSIASAELYGDVKRPKRVKLKYIDELGKDHVEGFDGFLSRVIQHEMDHLEGRLFTDIVDPKTLTSSEERGSK